ncbi:hypothetical protein [Desulfatitalea tepidiphila]|uniref:hypothetical protein n=1 Tax=Desulfatitalea tepidiphila TaxID=1185843 RepID=UPI0006B46EBD|nr:hypothetical protein [Desulfatitalea tepidiphila]
MNHISIASQSQDPVHVQNKIDDFFGRFKVATLMNQCGVETDHRTFGDLFYACCDEVADITFLEALCRILTLATDRLKQLGTFCEKTAAAFFDATMNAALQCVGLSKNKLAIA